MKKPSFFICLFLLLLIFPSLIQAQTKSIIIPAYAFHPMGGGEDFSMGTGAMWCNPMSSTGWFSAHVQLPDGARITKVVLRAYDNGDGNFYAGLWRRNMYTNGEQIMAKCDTTGIANSWRSFTDDTVQFWTVNNGGYGYYVCVSWGTARGDAYKVEGIKIVYLDPIT